MNSNYGIFAEERKRELYASPCSYVRVYYYKWLRLFLNLELDSIFKILYEKWHRFAANLQVLVGAMLFTTFSK